MLPINSIDTGKTGNNVSSVSDKKKNAASERTTTARPLSGSDRTNVFISTRPLARRRRRVIYSFPFFVLRRCVVRVRVFVLRARDEDFTARRRLRRRNGKAGKRAVFEIDIAPYGTWLSSDLRYARASGSFFSPPPLTALFPCATRRRRPRVNHETWRRAEKLTPFALRSACRPPRMRSTSKNRATSPDIIIDQTRRFVAIYCVCEHLEKRVI